MNITLLRKIQAAIIEEPDSFAMRSWYCEPSQTNCNTTACIAGYAVLLGDHSEIRRSLELYRPIWYSISYVDQLLKSPSYMASENQFEYFASLALGIDQDNELQDKLFYFSEWPRPYIEQYSALTEAQKCGSAELSQLAFDRIEHLINTGE